MNLVSSRLSSHRIVATAIAAFFGSLVMIVCAIPSNACAVDYVYDDTNSWRFYVQDDSTAAIISSDKYSTLADAEIPSQVTRSGETYTVTRIDNYAFGSRYSLKSAKIPSTVTSLGSHAFYSCSKLESVTFDGEGLKSIEDSAFCECSKLSTVTFGGDSLESIGDNAFYECEKLGSISLPSTLNSIGESAFYKCGELSSITLPDALEAIGAHTFYECKSLSAISFPSSLKSIGYKAFISCSALTTADFSKCTALTTIGEDAFNGCASITVLNLPEGLETIGIRAFEGCAAVETLSIPSTVTTWGGTDDTSNPYGNDYIGGAFKGCTSLKTLTLANGLRSLGPCAFYGCTSLASVELPSSLETLYYGAFKGCTSLTSIAVPNSVTTMYGHVFEGCTALEQVSLSENLTELGMAAGSYGVLAGEQFYGCMALKEIVIPTGVERLGVGVFYNCTALESITFEGSLKEIDYWSFFNCPALKSIELPNSVAYIGTRAFSGCTSLGSFTFPTSFASMGTNIFEGCSALKSIELSSAFTSIPSGFFQGCSGLESVTIPGTVTSIGSLAFQSCSKLETVIVLEGVTTIEYRAFANCTALKTVFLPSTITSIDANAFDGCSSDFVLYAPKGSEGASCVEAYAAEKNINYMPACHVTFDTGRGSAIAAQDLLPGTAASKPQDPTLDGYIFKGWQLNGENYDFATLVESDITLTAVWEYDSRYDDDDDDDDTPYFVIAAKVNVTLPIIKIGDELPSQVAATLCNAKGEKMAAGVAAIVWSTATGEIIEEGSLAQAATVYVANVSISVQKSTNVILGAQTLVSFNGVSAANQPELAADGTLHVTYSLRAAGSIDNAHVELDASSFVYTGSAFEPNVTVTLDGKLLEEDVDYELTYSDNTDVGTAMVTVTGIGVMDGQAQASFQIVPAEETKDPDDKTDVPDKVIEAPAKVTDISVKAIGKGKVKVAWAKHKAQTAGFEIRYGTNKAKVKVGKSIKTVKIKNSKAASKQLKKLKRGKRIYVQIRAYKVVDGKKHYSAWSKVASVKVK